MKAALLGLLVIINLALSISGSEEFGSEEKRGGGRRFNYEVVQQPHQSSLGSEGQGGSMGRVSRPGGKRSITGLYQSRFFDDSAENNPSDEANAEWREKRPGGRFVPMLSADYQMVKRPGGRRYSGGLEKRPGGRAFGPELDKRPGGRMALLQQLRQKKPGGRLVANYY